MQCSDADEGRAYFSGDPTEGTADAQQCVAAWSLGPRGRRRCGRLTAGPLVAHMLGPFPSSCVPSLRPWCHKSVYLQALQHRCMESFARSAATIQPT